MMESYGDGYETQSNLKKSEAVGTNQGKACFSCTLLPQNFDFGLARFQP